MTADDLPAAFAGLPAAWREVLPGWTPEACQAVVDRVRAVSGTREIAPADPFRALRLVAPADVKVVVLDRKSTRLNSSHTDISRMPSSA